jgi:hypothetical protein
VSWSLPFSEPVLLPDGSELATLRHAYDHLNKFPKSEQDAEEWKAAAHCLIEAAEHAGSVAFARIGILRAMKQQADRDPTVELVDLTMREVQQLKTDRDDPILRDQASLSLPGVMQAIVAIVSSPAVPVELSNPTSMGRGRESLWSLIKPTDDRRLIASETLQSAITKGVQKAEPAFVDVIIQRITPKSRFDTNWALRGVKFGRADREKANRAVTTVVERMQREFRLSDD